METNHPTEYASEIEKEKQDKPYTREKWKRVVVAYFPDLDEKKQKKEKKDRKRKQQDEDEELGKEENKEEKDTKDNNEEEGKEEKKEKKENKEKKTKKGKAKKQKPSRESLAVKGTQDDGDGWKWDTTLMYYESKDIKHSNKIAAFDFDNTLAKTSLRKKGPDAWSVLFPSIPQKLKELHDQNYKLVIFTNQSDIGRAVKPETRSNAITEKKGRLTAFIQKIGLPFQILVATVNAKDKDQYRKPATGMWDYFVNHLNGGIKPDMEASFFVGDAAGRGKSKGKQADHSDADKAFAEAVQIKFHTEDQFFK